MPIKAVLAIPYQEMVHFATGQPVCLPGDEMDPNQTNDIWVISVTDVELPPIFPPNVDKVLPLVFADIDPGNPDFVPPPDSQFMREEQAIQVVDFLEKAHASPTNVLLLVNCRYGQCRSGAIIDFAANVYGVGFWETKRRNPQMVPNYWVRYRLFHEHFKRKFGVR